MSTDADDARQSEEGFRFSGALAKTCHILALGCLFVYSLPIAIVYLSGPGPMAGRLPHDFAGKGLELWTVTWGSILAVVEGVGIAATIAAWNQRVSPFDARQEWIGAWLLAAIPLFMLASLSASCIFGTGCDVLRAAF